MDKYFKFYIDLAILWNSANTLDILHIFSGMVCLRNNSNSSEVHFGARLHSYKCFLNIDDPLGNLLLGNIFTDIKRSSVRFFQSGFKIPSELICHSLPYIS